MKFVNKTEDVYAAAQNPATKAYEELDNLLGFTLPEIEPGVEEIKGYSGMVGSIELPEWSNIGNLELAMKFSTIPEKGTHIMIPTGIAVKLNWGESYVDEKGSDLSYDSYAVYASGFPKNIPGSEKQKGEKSEYEFKMSCRTYKMIKNGVTIIEYDPLNTKICVNGKNYADALKNAMTKY